MKSLIGFALLLAIGCTQSAPIASAPQQAAPEPKRYCTQQIEAYCDQQSVCFGADNYTCMDANMGRSCELKASIPRPDFYSYCRPGMGEAKCAKLMGENIAGWCTASRKLAGQ